MKSLYDELLEKLGEPEFYDVWGVPRYCTPEEAQINPKYIKNIRCQECGRKFRVSLVGGVYNTLGAGDCRSDDEFGLMNPNVARKLRSEGASIEEVTDPPLVKFWHYGDPPRHGNREGEPRCYAGPTMNSVPEYEWAEFFGDVDPDDPRPILKVGDRVWYQGARRVVTALWIEQVLVNEVYIVDFDKALVGLKEFGPVPSENVALLDKTDP